MPYNKEKIKEASRQYRRQYMEKRKEARRQVRRQYRIDNPVDKEKVKRPVDKEKVKRPVDRDRINEQNRQYRVNNPEKVKRTRAINNWRREGLIHPDIYHLYDDIYLPATQFDVCHYIFDEWGKGKNWKCMDRDHDTNLFRQILCHRCNAMDNWKKVIRKKNVMDSWKKVLCKSIINDIGLKS